MQSRLIESQRHNANPRPQPDFLFCTGFRVYCIEEGADETSIPGFGRGGCLFILDTVRVARFVLVVLRSTWTPKVCKITAFMAVIMGLGLLFYILLGFR